MSSRSSKYYANDLHLFIEQVHGVICLDMEAPYNTDKEYGSFTMPEDQWVCFAKAILAAIEELREQRE